MFDRKVTRHPGDVTVESGNRIKILEAGVFRTAEYHHFQFLMFTVPGSKLLMVKATSEWTS